MKILVVGSGAREHAICKSLQADDVDLLVAPGNPGCSAIARCVDIAVVDVDALAELAEREQVQFVVIGPEHPLVLGLADKIRAKNIGCVGPSQQAAELENSKAFTRLLGQANHLPQPHFVIVKTEQALQAALETWVGLPVIKADGLASGKGVFLPPDKAACLEIGLQLLRGSLGEAGKTLVLEERLVGTEASLFFACIGTEFVALPSAQDHKRLNDGDQGPNTGGMGAISPNPVITQAVQTYVESNIVKPTLQALVQAGTPFSGFLFVGLMLTEKGPMLIEFNVRLGDPETQAILPRFAEGEFLQLTQGLAQGKLQPPQIQNTSTCAIVLSAAGYPEKPRHGDPIEIAAAIDTHTAVLHAGTKVQNGVLVTQGGRVLTVVAEGPDLMTAQKRAYAGVEHVQFFGKHFRRDIGVSDD
jgi:phosphoribosylamine---glycine ligase